MNITCHSEVGKIKSLFLKNVRDAFIDDVNIEKYWQDLNYLGKPDFNDALTGYSYFQSCLELHDPEIFYFPQDETVNIDSLYCRDAAIATNKGMIICNMGKAARANEPHAQKKIFERNGIPVLGTITPPGKVEGGDVAWLDEYTIAVGHGYRTNQEGIRQITALLQPLNVEVVTVPLPHYKGPEDVFHLMSIFSPVDTDLAVVYSALMPVVFRDFLQERGYQLLEVSFREFESMGCNVLALAPRECLMLKGNPEIKALLENAGCKVMEYAGDEISIKGGGGPTCLTRPLERYK
jgi:N-dimethylarginine dimethylaminohydrolase